MGLKLNLFSAYGASNRYSTALTCGISSGKKLAAAGHRTESSKIRFLPGQIGLELNNVTATGTLNFNSGQAFHAT